jgi:hypothetical protein
VGWLLSTIAERRIVHRWVCQIRGHIALPRLAKEAVSGYGTMWTVSAAHVANLADVPQNLV